MHCLGRARLVFNALKAPVSLRSLCSPFKTSVSTATCMVPRRVFSINANHDDDDDLFNYNSARWVYNEALRHAERRLVFDVEGLLRLAAQSVGRSSADVVDISKVDEGRFNRTFLITMRDHFQMIARVPYPVTVPKYFAVASEVATMDFLRSSGLPVPQVYGYSPVSDNVANTEYIFMEFISGENLDDVWQELEELDIASIMRQLVQLESRMMSISFPAGGSLYYTHDLEKVPGRAAIPLEDERFCVGPDTRLPMWFGRRSQLDVDRGPYESAEAALVAPAHKELAYLEQFGQPLLPFRRERREAYEYKEQPPSAHIENLQRYLLIAPSLVPKNPALGHFCIHHPNLQPNNIVVQKSPDSESGWQLSLLDWQYASVLPLFLHAGLPEWLQIDDDPVSKKSMRRPSRPKIIDELDEPERSEEDADYRRLLMYYLYVTNTKEHNKPHYEAITDPMCMFRRSLFGYAGNPWDGETLELKVALILATKNWKALTGAGGRKCPVKFDSEDILQTMQLEMEQEEAGEAFEERQGVLGIGPGGWVPSEDHHVAVTICRLNKKHALAKDWLELEWEAIEEHWPWDDMDEEKYM
ncbi:hypothetical protein GALMADRAFT_78401 [Galerina marginata CBS 339.88]|uniref:Uncharacterized protein n=1 Tax=Galerina marginata (strain CBS 339.88) TaxID=685588 RepID=A0A067SF43_GALM3|nr:hypothetical protein GALMADRAFT_78401 [Galerina marginata CBS 339.88]